MEYVLVDGYNVINAWGDMFDTRKDSLEDCRDKLVHLLSNYQGYKKTNVIVVFDAYMVKGSQEKTECFDNLTIVYTKENESADIYIERFVHKLAAEHTVRVVTSDYLEQTTIFSRGGIRITPKELRDELRTTSGSIREVLETKKIKTNTIMSHLDPELIEKLEKIRRDKF